MASIFTLRMSIGVEPLDGPAIPNRTILRRELENSIERLIQALDEMDGDPDHEDDGGREPCLGWAKGGGYGFHDDREEDRTHV